MMVMKDIGVLFDYNGVIVNDEDIQLRAFTEVLAECGIQLDVSLYSQHFLGKTSVEGVHSIVSNFSQQFSKINVNALVEKKRLLYQKYISNYDILYPGIIDVLNDLHKYCILVIVTSSILPSVRNVLRQYHLLSMFTKIISADDVTRGKPDPEGYLLGLKAVNLGRERIVVIEDTPVGVHAAKAAGLKCIALCHTSPKETLSEADIIIDTIKSVDLSLIKKLIKNSEEIRLLREKIVDGEDESSNIL
jgi:HAD superfamily hydrolase (TIGR01509 family)